MLDELVAIVAARPIPAGGRRVIGLAGGVAAGKTTLAETIAGRVGDATIVSTDVFLLSNTELEARGLSMRKGYPDSYDSNAMAAAIAGLRLGADVTVPSYSHLLYDIEAGVGHVVAPATTVIIEGVNALQPPADYDLSIYLEVDEADQRRWHRDRLRELIRAAVDESDSFYFAMAGMSDAEIVAFASTVWDLINGPNLRDHIAPTRMRADVVVRKDGDHRITAIEAAPRRV